MGDLENEELADIKRCLRESQRMDKMSASEVENLQMQLLEKQSIILGLDFQVPERDSLLQECERALANCKSFKRKKRQPESLELKKSLRESSSSRDERAPDLSISGTPQQPSPPSYSGASASVGFGYDTDEIEERKLLKERRAKELQADKERYGRGVRSEATSPNPEYRKSESSYMGSGDFRDHWSQQKPPRPSSRAAPRHYSSDYKMGPMYSSGSNSVGPGSKALLRQSDFPISSSLNHFSKTPSYFDDPSGYDDFQTETPTRHELHPTHRSSTRSGRRDTDRHGYSSGTHRAGRSLDGGGGTIKSQTSSRYRRSGDGSDSDTRGGYYQSQRQPRQSNAKIGSGGSGGVDGGVEEWDLNSHLARKNPRLIPTRVDPESSDEDPAMELTSREDEMMTSRGDDMTSGGGDPRDEFYWKRSPKFLKQQQQSGVRAGRGTVVVPSPNTSRLARSSTSALALHTNGKEHSSRVDTARRKTDFDKLPTKDHPTSQTNGKTNTIMMGQIRKSKTGDFGSSSGGISPGTDSRLGGLEGIKLPDAEGKEVDCIIGRYGDIMTTQEKEEEAKSLSEEAKRKKLLLQERDRRREMKWLGMIKAMGKRKGKKGKLASDRIRQLWNSEKAKVKARTRKGIPDSLRAVVWPAFTGSASKREANREVYRNLCGRESKDHATIIKDLPRTYPRHIMFKTLAPASQHGHVTGPSSSGQEALCRVLDAYAIHDPEVGYCQGIGFVAGIFLMYMGEEEAFWMLYQFMRGSKYNLHGLYTKGFPLLQQYFWMFDRLLKEQCKELWKHFHNEHEGLILDPSMYATQWFMTLFCKTSNGSDPDNRLPMEVLLRIWDIFLYEGPKILFKLGLFFFKYNEQELLKLEDLEAIMKRLSKAEIANDSDAMVNEVMAIKLSRAKLKSLAKKYEKEKAKEQKAKEAQGSDRKAASF